MSPAVRPPSFIAVMPPDRQRRAAWVITAFIAVAVLAAAVLYSALLRSAGEESERLAGEIAAANKAGAAARAQTQALRASGAETGPAAYLSGESAAESAAELEGHIKSLADRHGLTLVSLQPAGGVQNDMAVSLQIYLRSDYASFARFALDLREQPPAAAIGGAEIQSTRDGDIKDIRIRVTAYRRPGAAT